MDIEYRCSKYSLHARFLAKCVIRQTQIPPLHSVLGSIHTAPGKHGEPSFPRRSEMYCSSVSYCSITEHACFYPSLCNYFKLGPNYMSAGKSLYVDLSKWEYLSEHRHNDNSKFCKPSMKYSLFKVPLCDESYSGQYDLPQVPLIS